MEMTANQLPFIAKEIPTKTKSSLFLLKGLHYMNKTNNSGITASRKLILVKPNGYLNVEYPVSELDSILRHNFHI
jgi:hypothetical protein